MGMLKMRTFVPREDRRQVSMRGFALGSARDSDIILSDLSYEGCQFRSADAFAPGEIVELRIIKQGQVNAEVRWAGNGRAGVRFLPA